jgi:hypothetical protein
VDIPNLQCVPVQGFVVRLLVHILKREFLVLPLSTQRRLDLRNLAAKVYNTLAASTHLFATPLTVIHTHTLMDNHARHNNRGNKRRSNTFPPLSMMTMPLLAEACPKPSGAPLSTMRQPLQR